MCRRYCEYPYEVEIGSFLKDGTNHIRVEVTNLLINKWIDPEYQTRMYEETVSDEWPYFSAGVNRNRQKRISNWREIDMIKELAPSGLCGKVTLLSKE